MEPLPQGQQSASPQSISPHTNHSASPQGISPQGISLQGISPQGISPQGISPQGISASPQGISPHGSSHAVKSPQSLTGYGFNSGYGRNSESSEENDSNDAINISFDGISKKRPRNYIENDEFRADHFEDNFSVSLEDGVLIINRNHINLYEPTNIIITLEFNDKPINIITNVFRAQSEILFNKCLENKLSTLNLSTNYVNFANGYTVDFDMNNDVLELQTFLADCEKYDTQPNGITINIIKYMITRYYTKKKKSKKVANNIINWIYEMTQMIMVDNKNLKIINSLEFMFNEVFVGIINLFTLDTKFNYFIFMVVCRSEYLNNLAKINIINNKIEGLDKLNHNFRVSIVDIINRLKSHISVAYTLDTKLEDFLKM